MNDIKREITSNKFIVICGSMSCYGKMLQYREILRENGIPSIVPADESELIKRLSPEGFSDFKRKVALQYLRKIREKNVYGILVVNSVKKGIENYIGANTFAEISMAFCWKRRIFLLNDYFDGFIDELVAWEAIPLYGEIEKLFQIYEDEVLKTTNFQPDLFDFLYHG